MRPLLRSRSSQVCIALATVGMGATGFLPLFGGPGYESALAAGVLLPGLAAIQTALDCCDEPPAPTRAFVRGLENGAIVVGIGYVISLLHGLRVGMCDLRVGTALWALGPFLGALLGGVWGWFVGEVAGRIRSIWRSRVVAVVAALAGPALGVLVSLWRFYSSPMVYAYDPFFGFFSGILYDTGVTDSIPTLLNYRAGTFATLFTFGAVASLLQRQPKDPGLRLSQRRHPGVMWLATLGAVFSLVMTAEGAQLGHWQSAETITESLGGRITNERCDVIYPRSLRDEEAELLLRDCATQVREVISYLEIENPPQVKVFAFASPAQKRQLMGAASTSVAKPWRRELYIQLAPFPHPVMGHEIAHVMAGVFGHGMFDIAGSFGGLLPDPGLIEGVAVAASPEDDDWTPQQWAAAMARLEMLPALDKVFALGFFGENAPKSYTIAGAFVGWLRTTHGVASIRKWYGGTPIERAAGKSLTDLELDWTNSLKKIPVDNALLDHARSRFQRPSVFQRRCPHEVDALVTRGEALASDGDCMGAAITLGQASLLDPRDTHARLGISHCLPRLAGVDAARQQWQQMADDPGMSPTNRDRAREALADLDLVSGQGARAAEIYTQLIQRAFPEDHARALSIKALAAKDPREAHVVGELLIGGVSRGTDIKLAYALLGQWMAEVPDNGVPPFLLGKNLARSGLWHEAAKYLDEALRRRIPTPLVLRELLRQRAIVACAERDEDTARAAFAKWKADAATPSNRVSVLERRLGSCVR